VKVAKGCLEGELWLHLGLQLKQPVGCKKSSFGNQVKIIADSVAYSCNFIDKSLLHQWLLVVACTATYFLRVKENGQSL
jgi:hypothetical protein